MVKPKSIVQRLSAREELKFARDFHWWWRLDVPLDGRKPTGAEQMMRGIIRKYEPAAFWYELEARMNGHLERGKPKYPLKSPYYLVDPKKRRTLSKRYPAAVRPEPLRLNAQKTGMTRSPETEGFRNFQLQLNLSNFPDGTLVEEFKKQLALVRLFEGIPAPQFKLKRAHRIQSTGPSFRAVVALDVKKFAGDSLLQKAYERDYSRAQERVRQLRQFTQEGKPPAL